MSSEVSSDLEAATKEASLDTAANSKEKKASDERTGKENQRMGIPLLSLCVAALCGAALGVPRAPAAEPADDDFSQEATLEKSDLDSRPADARPLAGQVVTISPPGSRYIDPELLQEESLIAFQSSNEIWLARLDRETGDFVVPGGKETLIDTKAAPLRVTHNGPEFGLSSVGWALYYAKGSAENRQVWEAKIVDGEIQRRQLTSGVSHDNQLAGKGRSDFQGLLTVRHVGDRQQVVWLSVDHPSEEHPVDDYALRNVPTRWAEGGRHIAARRLESGQIFLVDTRDNSVTKVSNDEGYKSDPSAWFAPEFGGDMLVYGIVDDKALAVFKDNGGEYWERIASVPIPEGSVKEVLRSPQPFVFNGKSYFCFEVQEKGVRRTVGGRTDSRDKARRDQEVWIVSLDGSYQEECGDGTSPVSRSDPEVFVGTSNVFVYYYVWGSFEIRRYTSKLSLQ
jgi:hypothetical protein